MSSRALGPQFPSPKKGQRFTHKNHLDTSWKPGPGQGYKDAPHVEYEVSRTTPTTVYYRTPGATKAQFKMSRDAWDRDYGMDKE